MQRAIGILEHHLHIAIERLVAAVSHKNPVMDADLARCHRRKAGDRAKQGRLAGAGLADDADGLAGHDIDADVVQRPELVIGDDKIFDGYGGGGHRAHSGLRSRTGRGWRSEPIAGMQFNRPWV
ncbi:hypothetical protein D9M70_624620 [compost metagenome]